MTPASTSKAQIGVIKLFVTVFSAVITGGAGILLFGDRLYVTPNQWEGSRMQIATLIEQENSRLTMLKDIKDEQWLMRGQINAMQLELVKISETKNGGK